MDEARRGTESRLKWPDRAPAEHLVMFGAGEVRHGRSVDRVTDLASHVSQLFHSV